MLIGLLVAGVFTLHQNQLRFTNLGHIGRLKAKLSATVADAEDNTTTAATLMKAGGGGGGGSGEHVGHDYPTEDSGKASAGANPKYSAISAAEAVQ